jgi:hypothetical protein
MGKPIRSFLFIALCALCSVTLVTQAAPASDMPSTWHGLTLNGKATRTKFFIHVYDIGLYLQKPSHDTGQLLNNDMPWGIRLVITTGMATRQKMIDSFNESFEKSTSGNIGPLKERINTFLNVFKEDPKEGDVLGFVNKPGEGVVVSKNDKVLSTVPGKDFQRALLGIWLGEKPAQESVKKGLLGQ